MSIATQNSSNPSNKSKPLGKADDGAAQLLINLLAGDPGRGFDVEGLYLEQLPDGRWHWIVWEFLKTDGYVPPLISHPNFYWSKNSRKFLSLWTLVKTLRQAGFEADLMLLNYSAKNPSLGIKSMRVLDIQPETAVAYRHASTWQGKTKPAVLNRVVTENQSWTWEAFQVEWRRFNREKKGETWELLPFLQ